VWCRRCLGLAPAGSVQKRAIPGPLPRECAGVLALDAHQLLAPTRRGQQKGGAGRKDVALAPDHGADASGAHTIVPALAYLRPTLVDYEACGRVPCQTVISKGSTLWMVVVAS
jgi:hypothetical protein